MTWQLLTVVAYSVLFTYETLARIEEKSVRVLSNGFQGDGFGYDVDASENFMIIGCPNDIANGKRETGSAIIYPFTKVGMVGDGYKIVPPATNMDRYFGRSVAISNDHVIVGSRYTNQSGQLTGSAYIYKRTSARAWTLHTTLMPRDGAAHDGFGYDVDIHDNHAVVSSFKDDDNGWNSGSVYVFKYDSSDGWQQQAKISANDGAPWDLFGYSVSIHKNNIVVGAISHDSNNIKNSGAAYVFTRNYNAWGLETKLTPPFPRVQGFYGCSVDLYGNRLAVGAYGEDGEAGSVYVYTRSLQGWSEDGKFTEANKGAGNHFGWSVSTDGKSVVVGSLNSGDQGLDSGAAYIYITRKDVPENRKLLAYNKLSEQWFGRSVSIHNGRVVVGSYSDKLNNNGSVYVFDISEKEEPTVLTWVLGIIIPAVIVIMGALLIFRFRVRLSNTCFDKGRDKSPAADENENVPALEEHMLKPVSVRT